jgi:hypothetical protein
MGEGGSGVIHNEWIAWAEELFGQDEDAVRVVAEALRKAWHMGEALYAAGERHEFEVDDE